MNIPEVAARGPSLMGSLAARPALPGCAVPTLESSLEGRLPRPGEGTSINCFRSLSGGRLPLLVPHSGAPLAHWMALLSGDLTRELNVSHFHRTALPGGLTSMPNSGGGTALLPLLAPFPLPPSRIVQGESVSQLPEQRDSPIIAVLKFFTLNLFFFGTPTLRN